MKLYIEEIHGCFWYPHHIFKGYPSDKDTQGRCKAVFTRKDNYKLIWEDDMYIKNHPQNPYYTFPKWCPLKDKEE